MPPKATRLPSAALQIPETPARFTSGVNATIAALFRKVRRFKGSLLSCSVIRERLSGWGGKSLRHKPRRFQGRNLEVPFQHHGACSQDTCVAPQLSEANFQAVRRVVKGLPADDLDDLLEQAISRQAQPLVEHQKGGVEEIDQVRQPQPEI